MGENKDFFKSSKKRILPQMFDVRPVNRAGDLDVNKIKNIKKTIKLPKETPLRKINSKSNYFSNRKKFLPKQNPNIFNKELREFPKTISEEKTASKEQGKRAIKINDKKIKNVKNISVEFQGKKRASASNSNLKDNFSDFGKSYNLKTEEIRESWRTKFLQSLLTKNYGWRSLFRKLIFWRRRQSSKNLFRKYFLTLAKISIAISIVLFLSNYINKGLKIKNDGPMKVQKAFAEIMMAKDSIKNGNFEESYIQFNNAYQGLNKMTNELNGLGRIAVNSTKYIPYLSKISSGSHIVTTGNDISQAGVLASKMLQDFKKAKSQSEQGQKISYLKLFQNNEENLKKISVLLQDAQDNLDDVNVDDLPEKDRVQFIAVKKDLPQINSALDTFLSEEHIFVDILGGNGPRKYLFLFQNNQEMRATGGFIGSYGLLNIFNGNVRQFFIDGIYNPDGQLKNKIVPPVPIQKISASWSLHDSNWWPDFPTSAEKAIWFYEKTGGPTVDGVIAITPTVMQKLLKITGPIDMPKYGLTIDEDNFIPVTQKQVETNYDKTINRPKRILADLAPKVLEKLFNHNNLSETNKIMDVILNSLNEKQVLIYSRNWDIEKILSQNNWSGEILNASKDYVSVINTNINGFKTDGVIKENISHQAQIQSDGTVIDTLTITRKHNGGNTPYAWWNKVNSDYMRVYVPKGARLISAQGQTRELDTPPLDYNALKFQRDPQVQMEEDKTRVDEASGTKIYNESGKTVFANWVYVSPGETVTVKYVYALPFKITTNIKKPADTYSLLVQKQSGSVNNQLVSEIDYPNTYKTLWQYPKDSLSSLNNLPNNQAGVKIKTDLKTDKFIGLALSKK